jgi:hypothetical protein
MLTTLATSTQAPCRRTTHIQQHSFAPPLPHRTPTHQIGFVSKNQKPASSRGQSENHRGWPDAGWVASSSNPGLIRVHPCSSAALYLLLCIPLFAQAASRPPSVRNSQMWPSRRYSPQWLRFLNHLQTNKPIPEIRSPAFIGDQFAFLQNPQHPSPPPLAPIGFVLQNPKPRAIPPAVSPKNGFVCSPTLALNRGIRKIATSVTRPPPDHPCQSTPKHMTFLPLPQTNMCYPSAFKLHQSDPS